MTRFIAGLFALLILSASPASAQLSSCDQRVDNTTGVMSLICTDATGGQVTFVNPATVHATSAAGSETLGEVMLGKVLSYGKWALLVIVLLFLANTFIFTVAQQDVAIIERFGKYARIARAGLNVKWPFIEGIVHRINLRLTQMNLKAETKTKDNVFVELVIAVQYRVKEGNEFEAYYHLENWDEQIQAYVLDVVRAQVPKMDLDEVFDHKDQIGQVAKAALDENMAKYGFEITDVLVTDVIPDEHVAEAMNQIQTQARMKVAAEAKAEAAKIMTVKAAEAEAEAKALQGKGVADQRKAIVAGLKESVEDFAKVTGVPAAEVMQTITLTMYTDMLREIGTSANAKTIFIPQTPGNLLTSLLQAKE